MRSVVSHSLSRLYGHDQSAKRPYQASYHDIKWQLWERTSLPLDQKPMPFPVNLVAMDGWALSIPISWHTVSDSVLPHRVAVRYACCSPALFPDITLSTSEFAIASYHESKFSVTALGALQGQLGLLTALSGSFCIACAKAASASGSLPRCNSATACPTSDLAAEVDAP